MHDDQLPPTFEQSELAYRTSSRLSTSSQRSNTLSAPATRPSFTVNGKQLTAPLVTVQAVKDHLKLLGAFHQLKLDVLANKQPELEAAGITDEDRWSIFLVKAHLRFVVWMTCRQCEPETYDLPMMDFLFIWYTYLVHPRAFFEDNGEEGISRGFSIHQAAEEIDDDTRRYRAVPADAEKRRNFEQDVGYSLDVDFNLVPDAGIQDVNHVHPVVCPKCQFVEYAPYVSLQEPTRGYAHRNFSITCRQCSMTIDREALSVARFALTLMLYMKQSVYLAGTQLHPVTGRSDGFLAAAFNNGITTELQKACRGCDEWTEIGERLGWKMSNAEALMRKSAMGITLPERVTKIVSCYAQPQCSVDLVTAAKRQMLYIEELADLGWLAQGAFDSDSSVLEMAVGRYHQYLDLVASQKSTSHICVPTLDINLVLQTHQLAATDYRNTLIRVMGVLPDNNTRLPQKEHIANFDKTAKLFNARFRLPYSFCSCDKKAFSSKVSASLSIPSKNATKLEDVLRVLGATSGEVVTAKGAPSQATHPCGHSMILPSEGYPTSKIKGKASTAEHRNTLTDPSESWRRVLTGDAYGYGPAVP